MSSPWKALVEYKRAGLTEATKFGALCWVSGKKILHLCGENALFYGRSSAKPMHMKVLAKDLDRILSWEEKALSIASHNAEAMHLHVLEKILSKDEKKWIQVPASMPLQFNAALHKDPQQNFHPCSGEHSAIIRGCLEKHWSVNNYTSLDHPFHIGFMSYIQSVLGTAWRPEFLAVDGCSLATVSFSLSELASLYANLVREKNQDWIWEAMVRNPHLVGGTGRLDTAIMQACKGNVIAKEGAEGLLGMSMIHSDYPDGLGIVIKLAHGSDSQAMWHIAHAILAKLGWNITPPNKLFRQEAVVSSGIHYEL